MGFLLPVFGVQAASSSLRPLLKKVSIVPYVASGDRADVSRYRIYMSHGPEKYLIAEYTRSVRGNGAYTLHDKKAFEASRVIPRMAEIAQGSKSPLFYYLS